MQLSEPVRISGRMKNALIADLVNEAETPEAADRLLIRGVGNDEYEWTGHLGRQLGLEAKSYRDGRLAGLHDTLMVLIPELDHLLRQWPPALDHGGCLALARSATQGLEDVEVYATLLAGSSTWRNFTVGADCRVENLASHLRTTIERALAADIGHLIQRWEGWRVHRVRDQWEEAKARADAADAEAKAEARERARLAADAAPKRKKIPPPPDISKWKRHGGYYEPPGRTN